MSVAIPIPLLQNLPDVNVSPGSGVDEYALVYDHGTAQFVLRAPFAGILATGATVGATSQAQRFTNGILTGSAATSLQPGTVVAAGNVDVSGTSLGTHAFADEQQLIGIDIGSGYSSFDARAELVDATARTHLVGYQSRNVVKAGAGNITDYMDGYNSAMTHLGAGSIAAMHHFRAIKPVNSGGGTITTQYGLKVESLSGASTNYGVWIGDVGNAPSYGLYNEGSTYLKANTIITPFLDLLTPNVAQDYAPLRLNGIGHGVGDETRIGWYESMAQEYPLGYIGAAFQADSTGGYIAFATRLAGTVAEKMRLDKDGRLGIGTPSPATALHVVGAATITGGIRPAADSTTALQLQNAAGTSVLNVDTTNARVVLGASALGAKLDILGGLALAFSWSIPALDSASFIGSSGDGSPYPFDEYGNLVLASRTNSQRDIAFLTGNSSSVPTAQVVIKRITGNVGIGTTTPAEALDVTGNINTTGVVKVDDVQVLSNRVIDARCADVANSGDATTDGLIDALRDAMIAHGLIAASA